MTKQNDTEFTESLPFANIVFGEQNEALVKAGYLPGYVIGICSAMQMTMDTHTAFDPNCDCEYCDTAGEFLTTAYNHLMRGLAVHLNAAVELTPEHLPEWMLKSE